MDSSVDAAIVIRQVVRFYQELWNGPDVGLVAELLHPEITFRARWAKSVLGTTSSSTTSAR